MINRTAIVSDGQIGSVREALHAGIAMFLKWCEAHNKHTVAVSEIREALSIWSPELREANRARPFGTGGLSRSNGAALDPRVERAMLLLDGVLAEPANLMSVAASVRLSPWHLSRLIKANTGRTFREILTEKRMERAAELLRCELQSIKEVSAIVGYKNTSDFDRNFKRRWSVTPTQFRLRYFPGLRGQVVDPGR